MATRPHLTEEMQAFLQAEFGTTNISGTANALLLIGMYAIGVQPPADEAPRLLRRSDLPARLAGYVKAIGENPGVPASPLLSPQVMSLMSQLLGSVQALTSVPWRMPDVQHAAQQSTQAGAVGLDQLVSEQPALTEEDDDESSEGDADEQPAPPTAAVAPASDEQPAPPAAAASVPAPVEQPTPPVRPQRERPRPGFGRQRVASEPAPQPEEPVGQNSPISDNPPIDEVPVALPVNGAAVIGPEEEGEPVVVGVEEPAPPPTPPTPAAPKRRPLGRTFQG